jgi:hypothetical protein
VIVVRRIYLWAGGNIDVTFQERKNGVAKIHMGPITLNANKGLEMPNQDILMVNHPSVSVSCSNYIDTDPGASLELVTSNNQQISGQIACGYR